MAKQTSFDPYYQWLGIPPDQQPPHHYRLLGLALFESDAEVINNAADRQMMLLRTFQAGERSAHSQKLLNEVAAARICLLKPERKAEYDAQLREQLSPAQPPAAAEPEVALDFDPVAMAPLHAPARGGVPWIPIGIAGVCLLGLVAVVLVILARRGESPVQPGEQPLVLRLKELSVPPVNPGQWVVTRAAVDQPHRWQQKLSYSLADGAPDGASINAHTGDFRWQPAEPGEYDVTVQVSSTEPAASDQKTFRITVLGTPRPPVAKVETPATPGDPPMPVSPDAGKTEPPLASDPPVTQPPTPPVQPLPAVEAEPGKTLTITTKVAGDTGQAALVYRLAAGAPEGMAIDPETGTITWQVPADAPAGEFSITVSIESSPFVEPSQRKSFARSLVVRVVPSSTPAMEKPESVAKVPPKPAIPVPDEEAVKQAVAQVREQFKEQYHSRESYERLALAAQLIRGEATENDPAVRYAMLQEAQSIANQAGDFLLELAAQDSLGKGFQVDAAAMKARTLTEVLRKQHSSAEVEAVAQAAVQLVRGDLSDEAEQAVVALLDQIAKLAKKVAPGLAQAAVEKSQAMAELKRLYAGSKSAEVALASQAADPQANFDRGLYLALVEKDWDAALPLLAKSERTPLVDLAAKVSHEDEAVARLAMGDYWWSQGESAGAGKPLYRDAAIHWYELAAPGLAPHELEKILARIDATPKRPAVPRKPLMVGLGGLGGRPAMMPEKQTGNVLTDRGENFAAIGDTASVEYPLVPAGAYVNELEVTFAKPDGYVRFEYDGQDLGSYLQMSYQPNRQKIHCIHAGSYRLPLGARPTPGMARRRPMMARSLQEFDAGQRLRFTVYVCDHLAAVYHEDTQIAETEGRMADLRFAIRTGGRAGVVVHRCEFRKWSRADSVRLGWPEPPKFVACDVPQTAVALHSRNAGLKDKPIVERDNYSFFLAGTNTPMIWVSPGKFVRTSENDPNLTGEVRISRPFWIGRYEITQQEWNSAMPGNPSRVSGSPFLPVDSVSWEQAMIFCRLLTERETKLRRLPAGYEYRLPTEAEWEYASRAGSNGDYGVASAGFWHAENSGGHPHEVGQGAANPFGLYDMHGNVPEWCLDAWRSETDASAWRNADPVNLAKNRDEYFVVRGGGWWEPEIKCTNRARPYSKSLPGGYRGFRLVLGPSVRPAAKP